jgi:hypothetical protein
MRCFRLYASLGRAAAQTVLVWVNEHDLEAGERRAREHLKGRGWTIHSMELSMSVSPEEYGGLDKIQRGAYDLASKQGVYAYLHGGAEI